MIKPSANKLPQASPLEPCSSMCNLRHAQWEIPAACVGPRCLDGVYVPRGGAPIVDGFCRALCPYTRRSLGNWYRFKLYCYNWLTTVTMDGLYRSAQVPGQGFDPRQNHLSLSPPSYTHEQYSDLALRGPLSCRDHHSQVFPKKFTGLMLLCNRTGRRHHPKVKLLEMKLHSVCAR